MYNQGTNLTLRSQNIKKYFALILTIHSLIPFKIQLDNNYKRKKNCFLDFLGILGFEFP